MQTDPTRAGVKSEVVVRAQMRSKAKTGRLRRNTRHSTRGVAAHDESADGRNESGTGAARNAATMMQCSRGRRKEAVNERSVAKTREAVRLDGVERLAALALQGCFSRMRGAKPRNNVEGSAFAAPLAARLDRIRSVVYARVSSDRPFHGEPTEQCDIYAMNKAVIPSEFSHHITSRRVSYHPSVWP